MSREHYFPLSVRITYGIVAAIIAGLGALIGEAVDFLYWDFGWVEAETLSEYVRKVWFFPVGFALMAFFGGLFKGAEALDWANEFWTDIGR